MSRNKARVFVILFLVLIITPYFSYSIAKNFLDTDNYEKRNLQSKPVFSLKGLDSFSQDCEAYVNDHLPYRNQLILINNFIDYSIFKQSTNKNVILGQNGWLFYSNPKDGEAARQSLHYLQFTDEQLEKITAGLLTAQAICEKTGTEFVLCIPPNKESIYSNEFPKEYSVSENSSSYEQLVNYLQANTDIRIVLPYDELKNAQANFPDEQLYFYNDTHWNALGGYVGARCLAKELGINMKPLEELTISKTTIQTGDLVDMLRVPVKLDDTYYSLDNISSHQTTVLENDFFTNFSYKTEGADKRRLFVYRDSFSTALAPSLATQFENSLFVNASSFTQQDYFDYNADIFVLEIVERSLPMLEYESPMSFVNYVVETGERKNINIKSAVPGFALDNVTILNVPAEGAQKLLLEAGKIENEFSVQLKPDDTGYLMVSVFDNDEQKTLLENVYIYY